MSQIRLYITTSEAGAARALDAISAAFEEDGYAISTMEIDEARDVWEASIYVETHEADGMAERLVDILTGDGEDVTIEREALPEIDWVVHSLEGLKPVRAGRFLVHGSHDRSAVRANDLAIEIDAGQAFGTGHHGTTSGCLEMLERVMRSRKIRRALDLGTGSGLLAIAIRKLQPAWVLATDIDPVAVEVARENVRKNRSAAAIQLATAAGFHAPAFRQEGPFDLIVANILARPLMAMAPDIRRHLKPGGDVILSGILASQRWKVLAAYNGQHMRHVATLWRNGWVTIHLTRDRRRR